MKITEIRIRKMQDLPENRMRAVVSITLEDSLVVHDLRVINGKDRLFVAMPSRKGADGAYKDIVHPISPEFRSYIENEVLAQYHRALEETPPPAQ